jgi:phage shock protein PspC (stress-responsive transcriptional regulator)
VGMTSPRISRSSSDKYIGGVAGGLAAHLDVDPTLVRVGFLVTTLFSGAGLVAYLILLAILPQDDSLPLPA